jgi:thiol:disulfide interchange protein DsbD
MNLTGGPLDYAIVFFGGVLVSFTPCAYPLLPIAVASIAGANTSGTRAGGFLLSLVYVLGMAASYSALAVVAALSGKVFGTIQNQFWPKFLAANVVLLFGLVMLDVVPLPTVSFFGPSRKGRGWFGVFIMGAASGFVLGPCTAPILGALLVHVAARHNVVFGVSLLFTFAFGLGTSLILAGTFSGFLASLPKSGAWTQGIKKFAGLALVALAEYYLLKAGQLM